MAELAGLVLAAFTITVRGLDGFARSLDAYDSWRHYRRELKSYARTLECQRIWCLDTIEELFDGIVTTDYEMAALIEDPNGHSWRQHEERLEERLGDAHVNFLGMMQDMTNALGALRHKIGIEDPIDWSNYTLIKREIKRLKLVLSKTAYAAILAKIDKTNKDLRGITHQNRLLEPARHKRRSKRNAIFQELQKKARSLYTVLVEGTAWSCKCRDQHIASLRLEARNRELSKTMFRVILNNGASQSPYNISSDQRSWTWREVDITSIAEPGLPTSAYATPQTSLIPPPRGSSHPRKNVQFAPYVPLQTQPPKIDMSEITDLCKAIRIPSADRVIGMVMDQSLNHRHQIYFAEQSVPTQFQVDSISLESLLKTSRDQEMRLSLSRRDRLQIAVTLASSVLQLDQTPWLRRKWSSAEIMFLYRDSQTEFDKPYLSSRLSSNFPEFGNQGCTTKKLSTTTNPIHHDALFALGIALIELAFGKPLEAMRRQEGNETDYVSTNLIDSVYNEMGGRYGDVVRRCVHCPFDIRNKTFENEDFLETVFDLVATPLAQDLEAFDGHG